MMLRPKFLFFLCLVLSVVAFTKDSNQEIVWPTDGTPVLRL